MTAILGISAFYHGIKFKFGQSIRPFAPCFMATDMDALVLGDFVMRKEQMSRAATAAEREKYLAQFELD